jgi:hypothetical protein
MTDEEILAAARVTIAQALSRWQPAGLSKMGNPPIENSRENRVIKCKEVRQLRATLLYRSVN